MWEDRMQELIKFQQQHGHCEVPTDDSDEYEDLSGWIRQVRSSYASRRRGEETEVHLTAERLGDLQNLGLQLCLMKPMRLGKRRLKELIAYKRLYGHHYRVRVPSNSTDFPKLTNWLKKLQAASLKREKEEIPILMEIQLSQLEKIGYEFQGYDDPNHLAAREITVSVKQKSWDQRVDELNEFKRAHGHFRVPVDKAEYGGLCKWVTYVRTEYRKWNRGERNRLTDDRLGQLKRIGFAFRDDEDDSKPSNTRKKDDIWTRRLEELKQFKNTHGHFRVSRSTGDHKALGLWLYICQLDYMRGTRGQPAYRLTPEGIRQLEAIGFDFLGTDEIWNQGLQSLKKFIRQHGHYQVPKKDEKYRSLYQWLRNTRKEYAKLKKGESSTLTKDRVRQFMEIELLLKQQHSKIGTKGSTRSPPDASDRRFLPPTSTGKARVATVTPQRVMYSEAAPANQEETIVVDDLEAATKVGVVGVAMPPPPPLAHYNGQMIHHHPTYTTTTTKARGIPSFLDGLEDAVGSMMEEVKRMEQDNIDNHMMIACGGGGGGGRPNQFWLEIGDRDGIDFFA